MCYKRTMFFLMLLGAYQMQATGPKVILGIAALGLGGKTLMNGKGKIAEGDNSSALNTKNAGTTYTLCTPDTCYGVLGENPSVSEGLSSFLKLIMNK